MEFIVGGATAQHRLRSDFEARSQSRDFCRCLEGVEPVTRGESRTLWRGEVAEWIARLRGDEQRVGQERVAAREQRVEPRLQGRRRVEVDLVADVEAAARARRRRDRSEDAIRAAVRREDVTGITLEQIRTGPGGEGILRGKGGTKFRQHRKGLRHPRPEEPDLRLLPAGTHPRGVGVAIEEHEIARVVTRPADPLGGGRAESIDAPADARHPAESGEIAPAAQVDGGASRRFHRQPSDGDALFGQAGSGDVHAARIDPRKPVRAEPKREQRR